ncbi:MAG: MurT ligase domain-containing protein, partial [Solirubrobacteraceae bacterium]
NLFRDQLDRFGELESIAERWLEMLDAEHGEGAVKLVLNADDPLIADLGRGRAEVTYFGLADPAQALTELQHASDSKHCRRCGAPYRYAAIYLGHLGDYHCARCGQTRPSPSVYAEKISLQGTRAASFRLVTPQGTRPVRLELPGLYNVYNAVAAAALCLSLGATLEQVRSGLQATTAAFGRAQEVVIGASSLKLLLVKNPAGANEILRTLALELGRIDLLAVLNDGIADGRDVSWVWDADFELLSGRIRHVTCSGTRAAELAVRLKYAGVEAERLQVLAAVPDALDAALERAAGRPLFVLPTYTAMLALQDELARRGHVSRYWEEGG